MKLKYSSLACACINKTSLHSYLVYQLFLLKNFRLINFCGFHYPRKIFNNEIFPDYGRFKGTTVQMLDDCVYTVVICKPGDEVVSG